ncbi:MAG: hypothetical protein QY318_00065 [Candidatus Dojkabacteria bacterium]|nr:MAG: hypothetical protein QY318_00065 [Candidatus Dojkabacteria bacterium]
MKRYLTALSLVTIMAAGCSDGGTQSISQENYCNTFPTTDETWAEAFNRPPIPEVKAGGGKIIFSMVPGVTMFKVVIFNHGVSEVSVTDRYGVNSVVTTEKFITAEGHTLLCFDEIPEDADSITAYIDNPSRNTVEGILFNSFDNPAGRFVWDPLNPFN